MDECVEIQNNVHNLALQRQSQGINESTGVTLQLRKN